MTTSTPCQVQITLSVATVAALINGGYTLYAMHAVEITDGAAVPVIWDATKAIAPTMQISWDTSVAAYTSLSPISVGKTIAVGSSVAADGGQTVGVGAGGVETLMTGGPANMISFANNVTDQFTIGFTRTDTSGTVVPIFAVPLYGLHNGQAYPSPQILLNFSTRRYRPGTMIMSIEPTGLPQASYGQSLLIDMTGANNRSVSYDINTGWDWGRFAWANIIPATADLSKILLTSEL